MLIWLDTHVQEGKLHIEHADQIERDIFYYLNKSHRFLSNAFDQIENYFLERRQDISAATGLK
jgi:hypothetical protein